MSHWLIGPHHVVECSTASVLSAAQGKVTFRETWSYMLIYACFKYHKWILSILFIFMHAKDKSVIKTSLSYI